MSAKEQSNLPLRVDSSLRVGAPPNSIGHSRLPLGGTTITQLPKSRDPRWPVDYHRPVIGDFLGCPNLKVEVSNPGSKVPVAFMSHGKRYAHGIERMTQLDDTPDPSDEFSLEREELINHHVKRRGYINVASIRLRPPLTISGIYENAPS